jgi:flagellar hook assembly protein FlgD
MSSELGLRLEYSLDQNYPNPFNPSTSIRFTVPQFVPEAHLAVFDLLGRVVWESVLHDLQPGGHEFVWTGKDLEGTTAGSGVYFYRISAGAFSAVRKMILLR